ncbi:DUF1380 family protein [Klebsiella sp. DNRA6]|nr:DUF1380 family protein [Klebsiella sp. DNRA6]NMD82163.1 DUF1380 family protein [Klebsiella sp. DNRA6]
MLYGTRKELNKKLKRIFGNEERYALLVWTKEDVMAQAWNMTVAEAHTLLELIGRTGTGEHTEEGVSFRTVQALYAGIRPGIPRVSVPVDTLYRITDIAAQRELTTAQVMDEICYYMTCQCAVYIGGHFILQGGKEQ